MHHQLVSRYASYLYRDAFAQVLGSGVVGTPPSIMFLKVSWVSCGTRRTEVQAREKSTKINFLGPARWGGGLPREGVVAEKFGPSLESLSSLGFEERNLGCPGKFAGMSRTPVGVQKACAKRVCAHFSFPRSGGGAHGKEICLGLCNEGPERSCRQGPVLHRGSSETNHVPRSRRP